MATKLTPQTYFADRHRNPYKALKYFVWNLKDENPQQTSWMKNFTFYGAIFFLITFLIYSLITLMTAWLGFADGDVFFRRTAFIDFSNLPIGKKTTILMFFVFFAALPLLINKLSSNNRRFFSNCLQIGMIIQSTFVAVGVYQQIFETYSVRSVVFKHPFLSEKAAMVFWFIIFTLQTYIHYFCYSWLVNRYMVERRKNFS